MVPTDITGSSERSELTTASTGTKSDTDHEPPLLRKTRKYPKKERPHIALGVSPNVGNG
jgi:hypothetical protein